MLVVEDDLGIQALLNQVLEPYAIDVECASTPEDALAMLGTQHYDGAIIDLILPGMNGCNLLESIRELEPDMPCIALTAYHSPELMARTVALGFNGYFTKPLQATLFARNVRNLLH
jgi:two-component system response regulator (stage 0 sporulation protein F)